MKRGDVVLVAPPGDFGKPRPAVVIQTDLINEDHASILLCLVTSHLADAPLLRLTVAPTPENGLQKISQIQADKVYTARREKIGPVIGRMDAGTMDGLGRALAFVMGLG
ncbi:type II toxin-antitoxin system PemK/MazF family toxin [Solidesulfovibrio sp.]